MLIHINIILLLGFLTLNAQQPKQKPKTSSKESVKEVAIARVNKPLTYYIVFEKGKAELSKEMKEKLDGVYRVFLNNLQDSVDILPGSEKTNSIKNVPFR